jgi:hypothetical protein
MSGRDDIAAKRRHYLRAKTAPGTAAADGRPAEELPCAKDGRS